ncbi:putative quinol monooxygenase [Rhizobium mongolense]|uniref:Quinol monooxygenase YgiN n=2 Tax=Rhizobium mongolense TaxID=57676 RepID=A0ABR6IIK8_9HYPH|nr:putative quinol monooxygenase [Rhizobium mongolense]MBB4227715.1 quinol monooxygenase YgiN [Rhizobium mongolense]TVZ65123.1 quinol monooxygenase YgiN [Rhizobium mongolense USDA 1844]
MSGKRVVRMAELEIDPAQLDAYRALLADEIEASVASERGVLTLYAVSIKDRPEKICIFEVYASQEDYEAHLQTPHFLKYKTASARMVRSLSLIDVDPIILRSKTGDHLAM